MNCRATVRGSERRKMSDRERTGWRDEAISTRHRAWGYNLPAVDVDFVLLEYDRAQPVALIEYKHEASAEVRASMPSYQALISLGNRAALPVFCVRYADDFAWFSVVPLNAQARLGWERTTMTEAQYVAFLYALRHRQAPPFVATTTEPPSPQQSRELIRGSERQRIRQELLSAFDAFEDRYYSDPFITAVENICEGGGA